MSPDFDKYRALAKATGDDTHYSDDDLMRLWAAMEHLFAIATQANCPQIFAAQATSLPSQSPLPQLASQHQSTIKETKE